MPVQRCSVGSVGSASLGKRFRVFRRRVQARNQNDLRKENSKRLRQKNMKNEKNNFHRRLTKKSDQKSDNHSGSGGVQGVQGVHGVHEADQKWFRRGPEPAEAVQPVQKRFSRFRRCLGAVHGVFRKAVQGMFRRVFRGVRGRFRGRFSRFGRTSGPKLGFHISGPVPVD